MNNADKKTIRDAAEAAEQALLLARDYGWDSPEIIDRAEAALARFRGRYADIVGPRQTDDEPRPFLTRRIT